MKYKVLTLNDLEDLNFLAEDVLHELRFHPYMYTDDGDYNSHYDAKERMELQELLIDEVKQSRFPLEFRNNKMLEQISFEEAVHMSHQKIIENFLKDYLQKFRGVMRKGSFPLTPFVVSEEITDNYLDNLFALRYKENLKLWTLQYKK